MQPTSRVPLEGQVTTDVAFEGQLGGLRSSPPYGSPPDDAGYDRFSEFARRLADAAGAVIRPYFRTCLTAERKGDQSPVTLADRGAEQVMRALIAQTYPDHGIVGEEYGAINTDADFCWVLDPVDGTRAFITGRPLFGTLISLLHHGVPVLGIIDQPVTGERWMAQRGARTVFAGPWGGMIGTRACAVLGDAELSCTSPAMLGDFAARFGGLADKAARVTWGGDCYAYGLLALGQIDIVAERDLKLWDWAAILPVVEGAGGVVTDWDGRPLGPQSKGDVLAVGDPALHALAVAALAGAGA